MAQRPSKAIRIQRLLTSKGQEIDRLRAQRALQDSFNKVLAEEGRKAEGDEKNALDDAEKILKEQNAAETASNAVEQGEKKKDGKGKDGKAKGGVDESKYTSIQYSLTCQILQKKKAHVYVIVICIIYAVKDEHENDFEGEYWVIASLTFLSRNVVCVPSETVRC